MLADAKGLDPRTLELIHKVADGSADSHEQGEWAQLLALSPALRPEFEAIQRVVQQMDTLPLVEPPASLKSGILQELRQRHTVPTIPLVGPTARKPAAALRRWQRPALAWAAGIALIAGSAYLLDRHNPSGLDPSDVSATIGARDIHSWRVVETFEPPAPGIGPKLILRRDGARFAVEARSTGAGNPGPVELRWDARALDCVAVAPSAGNLEALSAAGTVQLAPASEGGAGLLRPVVVLRLRAGFTKSQEVILLVEGKEYHRATILFN